jgi:hypothetical protein
VAEGLHEAVGVPIYVYYEPHRPMYGRTITAVRSLECETQGVLVEADHLPVAFGAGAHSNRALHQPVYVSPPSAMFSQTDE